MITRKINKVSFEDISIPEFSGTDRFSIIHKLGAGGFGVVYKAYDRALNSPVALKVLYKTDPEALYAFKNEFRALADVIHTNLVALYELLSQADHWFFTMELVEGVSFLDYVEEKDNRTAANSSGNNDTVKVALINVDSKASYVDAKINFETEAPQFRKPLTTNSLNLKLVPKNFSLARPPCNYDLLWAALKQLANGVNALHQAGKLHRDIKPSNVLVTTLGRVVLLDFGLVTELIDQNRPQTIVGTPLYMSPEQCVGLPLNAASDWYSVGVILYQVLTGRLPFEGELLEVLNIKQQYEPLAPAELFSDIPDDLNSLCWELLRRDPLKRPSGKEILSRLKGDEPFTTSYFDMGPSPIIARQKPFLMGRDLQLKSLYDCFNQSHAGNGVVTLVAGRSGIGKSALVRSFVDNIQTREPAAIVLMGRCYEQESVPYKALDSLIDALANYLSNLSPSKSRLLIPDDFGPLVVLFPVLRQWQTRSEQFNETLTPQQLRRRAVAALGQLLTRMATKPLVIFIDDLQWGDIDSAHLLEDLLHLLERPPMLFIGAYRSDEAAKSPFLQRFIGTVVDAHSINVGELSFDEACDLSMALLEGSGPVPKMRAAEIAHESGGNPFFIDELVRYYLDAGDKRAKITRLEDVILARVVRLPDKARALLELLAISGQPLQRSLTRQLVALEGEEQAMILRLRAGHLIRLIDSSGVESLETYHDRIRETMVAALSSDTAHKYHLQLAQAFESLSQSDPERIAVHYRAAEKWEKAAYFAVLAAAKAAEAFAFDRAVRLYRWALDIFPECIEISWSPEKIINLHIDLANALVGAGHAAEAAHEYLHAAKEFNNAPAKVDKQLTIKLRQTAAEQLLRAGHIDEGLQVVREVLRDSNSRLIESRTLALISLMLRRIQIHLKGFDFQERVATELPPDQLLKIDTFWSVAMGLGIVDTIRGTEFQARHLLLVLQAGEPYRIARALAIESGYSSLAGGKNRAHTEELVERANRLAEKIGNFHARALAKLMSGLAAFCLGQFNKARELTEIAEQMLRTQAGNYKYELDIAELFLLRSMFYRGELTELAANLNDWLKDAGERGDLYAVTNLTTRVAYITLLMKDRPADGQRLVTDTLSRWSQRGFFMQHFFTMIAQVEIALYSGDYLHGETILQTQWNALTHSLILNIQVLRVEAIHLRARSSLAMASITKSPKRMLAAANADAKRLEKEHMPYSNAFAALIRGGIASFHNDQLTAAKMLEIAANGFRDADILLYAMAARYRYGQVIGGKQGEAFVAEAEGWFLNQHIVNPNNMVNMLVPGNWPKN